MILPQISQQWHSTINHSTPGIPLMIHSPSSPISTVPIACTYTPSSFSIWKKFNTMAKATLEKLMVANMSDGPSDSCLQRPQVLDSFIRKREQQTIQEMNTMTMQTSTRRIYRFSKSSSQPSSDSSPEERNIWVSAIRISPEKILTPTASDLKAIGASFRYHRLLRELTAMISDCRRGRLSAKLSMMSSYRMAWSMKWDRDLVSLRWRATTLFMSRQCSMEDSSPTGQASAY